MRLSRFAILFGMLLPLSILIAREPIGQISFPLNRVFVYQDGTPQLKYARFEMEIFKGDGIETRNNSRCEIMLKNGNVFRIDENNNLLLDAVEFNGDTANCQLNYLAGDLWANSRGDSLNGSFLINVFSNRLFFENAACRFSSAADSIIVTVYEGDLKLLEDTEILLATAGAAVIQEIHSDSGAQSLDSTAQSAGMTTNETTLSAGKQITFVRNGGYSISDIDESEDEKIEWVQWNKRRDQLLGK